MHQPEYSTHARPVVVKRKRVYIQKLVIIAVFVAALVGAGIGYAYYAQVIQVVPGSMSLTVSSTSTATGNALQDVVRRVQKLIILPDEEAVMYTVDDAEKLTSEQAFFMGSQNGDVLLVFPKSQKAIIYSPARNIIVNVGPVTYEQTAAAGVGNQQGTTTSAVGTSTVQ